MNRVVGLNKRLRMLLKDTLKTVKENGFRNGCRFLTVRIADNLDRLFRRRRLKSENKHPPKVSGNKIVFDDDGRFAGNPRALFDYMMAQGYNKTWNLVWCVDCPSERCFAPYKEQGVRFVRKRYANGKITYDALHETRTAKYLFFSIAMNWVQLAGKEQVFVNLWHGCSFKADKGNGIRHIFFDYCIVPGPFFVDTKQKFFQCPRNRLLPVGYPCYDTMLKGSSTAGAWVKGKLLETNSTRMILWMPTYRKTDHVRLNENTLGNEQYDLPIVSDDEKLDRLNQLCAKNHILLVLKLHPYHKLQKIDTSAWNNILCLKNEDLDIAHIQLYELIHEADMMITDYSSVGVDYMLLDRPLAYTMDDYEAYRKSRGFIVEDPLPYMPGSKLYTMDDVENFITEMAQGKDPYANQRREVIGQLHTNQNGSYSAAVLDAIGFPVK